MNKKIISGALICILLVSFNYQEVPKDDLYLIKNDGAYLQIFQGENGGFSSPNSLRHNPDFAPGFDLGISGDWDSDGKEDIYLIKDNGVYLQLFQKSNRIYSSKNLRHNVDFEVGFDFAVSGDWNNDRKDDIYLFKRNGVHLTLLQKENGQMSSPTGPGHDPALASNYNFALSGDWNSDGKDDIFLAKNDGSTLRLLQNERGKLIPSEISERYPFLELGFDFALSGDWDNDGREDIFFIKKTGSYLRFLQKENGVFSTPYGIEQSPHFKHRISFAVAGDWNNDGMRDIFLIREDGIHERMLQQNNGTFQATSPKHSENLMQGFHFALPNKECIKRKVRNLKVVKVESDVSCEVAKQKWIAGDCESLEECDYYAMVAKKCDLRNHNRRNPDDQKLLITQVAQTKEGERKILFGLLDYEQGTEIAALSKQVLTILTGEAFKEDPVRGVITDAVGNYSIDAYLEAAIEDDELLIFYPTGIPSKKLAKDLFKELSNSGEVTKLTYAMRKIGKEGLELLKDNPEVVLNAVTSFSVEIAEDQIKIIEKEIDQVGNTIREKPELILLPSAVIGTNNVSKAIKKAGNAGKKVKNRIRKITGL